MLTGFGGRRLRALVVVVAACTAVLPRGAAAAPPSPALTGRVTVSGSGAGHVPVMLAKPVDFRADNAREMLTPTVTFTGGAYGWLLLTSASEQGQGFAGVTKLPAEQGGSVVFRIDGTDPLTGDQLFMTSTLPAGAYRLYLLTKGAGSATLRLPGLTGVSAHNVRTPAAVTTTTLGVPSTAGMLPPAYANGVTIDSDLPTLVLTYHWLRTTAQAAAHFGWCRYEGGPPGGQWLPGCPGADVALMGAYGYMTGCCGVGTGGGFFDAGRWGYGHFYDTAGVVEKAGDHFVVLTLR